MSLSESIQTKQELKERIQAMDVAGCRAANLWLNLSAAGSAAVLRDRLGGLLTGPARRHRAGWLQLALDCVVEGGEEDCDVAGCDYLFDLRERLDNHGLLPACLPFNLFGDLVRSMVTPDGGDTDELLYHMASTYRWFTVADVNAHMGIATDDVSELKTQIAALQASSALVPSHDELAAQVRDTIAFDVSEQRMAVGGNSSIAIQRKTLCFELNPVNFHLYSFKLHESGRGRDIIHGDVDQDWMRAALFKSKITPEDRQKMDRRSLVPEAFWTQAYVRDSDKILIMGGEGSPAHKADENLRIQQQALLKKCQHVVHVLAASGDAHAAMEAVLFSAGPGASMPPEDATALGLTFDQADIRDEDGFQVLDFSGRDVLAQPELERLRKGRASLEESIFAASDSFHIYAAELSELERQRDDCYVRARSGNDKYKSTRPSSDVTKYVKDMSELDKIADLELARQKNLQNLKKTKQPFRDTRNKDSKKGPHSRSKKDRRAQSQRDKAASAGRKGGARPEPQHQPKDKIKKKEWKGKTEE